jgi:hypothetical protein
VVCVGVVGVVVVAIGVVVVVVGCKLITVVRRVFDLTLGACPSISQAIYSISSSQCATS